MKRQAHKYVKSLSWAKGCGQKSGRAKGRTRIGEERDANVGGEKRKQHLSPAGAKVGASQQCHLPSHTWTLPFFSLFVFAFFNFLSSSSLPSLPLPNTRSSSSSRSFYHFIFLSHSCRPPSLLSSFLLLRLHHLIFLRFPSSPPVNVPLLLFLPYLSFPFNSSFPSLFKSSFNKGRSTRLLTPDVAWDRL